jgi:hypothetical protein
MHSVASAIDEMSEVCATTTVSADHAALLQKLTYLYPHLCFQHVLTRGGWYRVGGIIAADGERISHNLRDWLEQQAHGDPAQLIDDYGDAGYIATSLQGRTHYFVACSGERVEDFIQLEIEELQEVQDHMLFDPERLVDDLEELIDPLDVAKLDAEPRGAAFYSFRRFTDIGHFVHAMDDAAEHKAGKLLRLQRFMRDWERSSSRHAGPFCHHWVLALREYTDAWGEQIREAKPISTFSEDVALMTLNGVHRGARLANLIHGFDHDIGYPMAWYFFMLSHREVPHQLAESIHRDLMGAYDYLPARDLKVLRDWSVEPYGI